MTYLSIVLSFFFFLSSFVAKVIAIDQGHNTPPSGHNMTLQQALHEVNPKAPRQNPEIDDIVIGHSNAKIKLVEYSSVNCFHCASFYQAFHQDFTKQFVDSGKVQFIFKHFPLDYTAIEYMSLIVTQPKDQWFPLFKKALATQDQWLGKKPEVLAKVLNISPEHCKKALTCEDTKKRLVAKRFNAEKHIEIEATPTFLIVYTKGTDTKFELYNQGITPKALLKRLGEIYKDIA